MNKMNHVETLSTVLLNRDFHKDIAKIVSFDVKSEFSIKIGPFEEEGEQSPNVIVIGLLVNGHVKITNDVLSLYPNLRVISNHGVGIEHIDVQAATIAASWCLTLPTS